MLLHVLKSITLAVKYAVWQQDNWIIHERGNLQKVCSDLNWELSGMVRKWFINYAKACTKKVVWLGCAFTASNKLNFKSFTLHSNTSTFYLETAACFSQSETIWWIDMNAIFTVFKILCWWLSDGCTQPKYVAVSHWRVVVFDG